MAALLLQSQDLLGFSAAVVVEPVKASTQKGSLRMIRRSGAGPIDGLEQRAEAIGYVGRHQGTQTVQAGGADSLGRAGETGQAQWGGCLEEVRAEAVGISGHEEMEN